MMKKALSALLAMAMLFAMIPVGVLSASAVDVNENTFDTEAEINDYAWTEDDSETLIPPNVTAEGDFIAGQEPSVSASIPLEETSSFAEGEEDTFNAYFWVDGEIYAAIPITVGDYISYPDDPNKVGYTFIGWDTYYETMPAEDIYFNAIFDVNTYNAYFLVDGAEYAVIPIAYGDYIGYPADPYKEGYTFLGWQASYETMPAEDIYFNAVFEINTYNAYYFIDGIEYIIPITYGSNVSYPDDPNKVGYTFLGWDTYYDTMPAEDIYVYAMFEINIYNAYFLVDGAEYTVIPIAYGDYISYPNDPYKEGYTFLGWQSSYETMPAEDLYFNAVFEINIYCAHYYINGMEYTSIPITYGDYISYPDDPYIDGNTFIGWGTNYETMPAEDINIYAMFEINTYYAHFLVDGAEYAVIPVTYGDYISNPTNPYKDGNTFIGWDNYYETMPAEDIYFNAMFDVNTYYAYFMVDGMEYTVIPIIYGDYISYPADPYKEGHTFLGWQASYETMPAEDLYFNAVFEINTYNAYFFIDGMEYIIPITFGDNINYPDDPSIDGYTFIGWDTSYETMPAEDIYIYAMFDANIYYAYFLVDGVEYAVIPVTYGDYISYPDDPYKDGHNFIGWDTYFLTMPAEDLYINANFYKYWNASSIEITRTPDKTDYLVGVDNGVYLDGMEILVHYADGTSALWYYNDYGLYFNDCYFDFYYDNFTVGSNIITVWYMGISTTFEVMGIENPVASIAVTKLPDKSTYIENIYGYWDSRWDGAQQEYVPFFYYNYSMNGMELTISYTDGTSAVWSYDENGSYFYGYQVNWYVNQYIVPWQLGSNPVIATYMDVQTTFDVKVIENPVESIEVTKLPDKTTYIENADGFWTIRWDEAQQEHVPVFYYNYSLNGMELTVYHTDGTSEVWSYDEYGPYFNGYEVNCNTDQYNTPWQLGGNQVTASYLENSTTFNFEVVENPVDSIEVTKLPNKSTYIENINGYWGNRWDEIQQEHVPFFYYYYDMNGMELTVYYKDGTSAVWSYDEYDSYFNGYYVNCSTDQYNTPWQLGGNPLTVSYMSAQTTFEFEVVESPVESIDVTQLPDKTHYIVGVDNDIRRTGTEITIHYTNGTSEVWRYDEDGSYYNEYYFDFSYDNFIVGSNTINVLYMGAQTTFEISGIENPVESIEVTKLPDKSTYIENIDGYWGNRWDEAQQKEVPYFYYEMNSMNGMELTIYYTDSTSEVWSYDENGSYFNGYQVNWSTDQYNIPWQLGGNPVTVSYMGAQTTFDMEVVETPVASIEVAKLPNKTSCIENIDGEWRTIWDEAQQEEVPFFYYYWSIQGLELTIHYTDGTSEVWSSDEDGSYFNGYQVNWSTDQYNIPWQLGGNPVTVSYMSAQTTFEFEVVESPVERIEVTQLPDKKEYIAGLYYGVNGINRTGMEITVDYTDGTSDVWSYDEDDLYYNGYSFNFYYDDIVLGDNTVTVWYMGKSTTFEVTGIENPVESIEVTELPDKTTYIENIDGYWSNRWDEALQDYISFFCYDMNDMNGMELTIYYTDGTNAVWRYNEVGSYFNGYNVNWYTDQHNTPWQLGGNTVTVSYMGAETTFDVEVIENPVESIEVTKLPDKINYIENADGYWDSRWDEAQQKQIPFFFYNYAMNGMELTINFTDGTNEVWSYNEDYPYPYFIGYQVNWYTDQYNTPWQLGGNTVTVSYMGAETTFDVEVIENPVERIEVTKLPDKTTYIENTDGNWRTRWDETQQKVVPFFYYSYDLNGMELTVYYTDGTSAVWSYDEDGSYFNGYNLNWNVDQYDTPWQLGSNPVTLSYLEKSTPFNFEVVETPVASIEVTKLPNKTTYVENADGNWRTRWDEAQQEYIQYFHYYYSMNGMELTVSYTNGTSEVWSYDEDGSFFNGYQVNWNSDQNNTPWQLGSNPVIVIYMDAQTTFEVEVVETPVASIEVTKLPDKTEYIAGLENWIDKTGMEITVSYTDGTSAVWSFNDDGSYFNDYNVSINNNNLIVGSNTITVKYMDRSTTFMITGTENPVANIEVTKLPDKTEFIFDVDILDLNGMEMTVYYTDETSAVWVFADFDDLSFNGYEIGFSADDEYKIGTFTIILTYMGAQTTFDIALVDGTGGQLLQAVPGKTTIIDTENGFIYGLTAGISSLDDFVVVKEGYELQYIPTSNGFGTGTIVNVVSTAKNAMPNSVVASYTLIIYGDVNGDATIDSMDAGTMVDYENYLVDWDETEDAAKIEAADLNDDGKVDSMDAGIAVDAENYVITIDQTTGLVA